MAKKKRKKAVTKKRKKTKKSIKKRKKLKSRRHKKLSSAKKPKKVLKSKSKKRKKTRGVKMSAEAMKVSSVLDTSHLKVKFPFKAKYGNYINGKFVAVSYTHLTLPTNTTV